MRVHQFLVDHGAQIVHRELFHFGDFVDVRKPSKKCRKGMRDSMLAACAMSARSITSCTELEDSMPTRWSGRT